MGVKRNLQESRGSLGAPRVGAWGWARDGLTWVDWSLTRRLPWRPRRWSPTRRMPLMP